MTIRNTDLIAAMAAFTTRHPSASRIVNGLPDEKTVKAFFHEEPDILNTWMSVSPLVLDARAASQLHRNPTLCREQVLEVSEASRRQPSPSPLESASTHASECDAIPILLSDKCQTTQSNDEPPEGKGLRAVQRGRLLFEEKSPKPSEIHVGDGAEAARRRLGQMRIGLVNFTIETEFDRIACEIDPYQDRV